MPSVPTETPQSQTQSLAKPMQTNELEMLECALCAAKLSAKKARANYRANPSGEAKELLLACEDVALLLALAIPTKKDETNA